MIICILSPYLLMGCFNSTNDDHHILSVDINGTKQYTSIQQAIDTAYENDTIYVYPGVYYENIIINRSIILKGDNKENTIIDGTYIDTVILIDEDCHVRISGFTIRHSGKNETKDKHSGIRIKSDNNSITEMIICNNSIGIYSSFSKNNTIQRNIINSNTVYGIYLDAASYHSNITENTLTNNYYALRVLGSRNNIISKNLFSDNDQGVYFCCGSRFNIVYHNTFMNNTICNGKDDVGGNYWDNGYPYGGNYWDDYNGIDELQGTNQTSIGNDGIGDTAYIISTTNDIKDRYPLMQHYREE